MSPIKSIDLYEAENASKLQEVYLDFGFSSTLNLGVGFRFEHGEHNKAQPGFCSGSESARGPRLRFWLQNPTSRHSHMLVGLLVYLDEPIQAEHSTKGKIEQ